MGRNRLLLITLASVGVAAVVGMLTGRALWPARHAQPAPPETERPALTIDPRHLNFGEVWETDRFEWTVPIRNTTGTPLTVLSLNGSCSCLSLAPNSFTIPPGQEQRIKLIINLKTRGLNDAPLPKDDFSSTFWATVSGNQQPAYWTAHGRVRRAIAAPEVVDLGTVSQRSAGASMSRVVIRLLSHEVSGVTAESSNGLCASLLPSKIDRLRELALSPACGLPLGRRTETVTITARDSHNAPLSIVRIPVEFVVGTDVQAVPSAIQFGTRFLNEHAAETIILRSLSNTGFRVRNSRTTDTAFQLVKDSEQNGADFQVRFEASRVGHTGAFVIFDVTLDDGEDIEVRVPVSGFGASRS